MNPKLEEIMEKTIIPRGMGNVLLDVIRGIALEYDRDCGEYPEHEYEGLAFYMFCKEGSFAWPDYDDFDMKDDWWKELNEPDIRGDTEDKAAALGED
jgi:hypothetical protein